MAQLVSMTEDDYQQFVAWAVPDYAQEQDKAVERAEYAFGTLSADGLSTPNQFFCVIEDETSKQKVGNIWYGICGEEEGRFVAIHELMIYEEYRRQGYGSQALLALEDKVNELGIKQVALHVLGHNGGARALYRESGYRERDVTMLKELD